MARKNLSTRIDNDLQKEVKKLAIDLEKPLNDLLEEAIRDLLSKYDRRAPVRRHPQRKDEPAPLMLHQDIKEYDKE